MYNIALSDGHESERASIFLKTLLDLDLRQVGRFRDTWLELDEQGEPRIALYTRNGGGNRPDYTKQTAFLQGHPEYLFDRDDTFDSTYATYYFKVPQDFPAHLSGIGGWTEEEWPRLRALMIQNKALPEPVDTSQRWLDAIEKLNKEGPSPEQEAQMQPVIEALAKALNGPDDNGPKIIQI